MKQYKHSRKKVLAWVKDDKHFIFKQSAFKKYLLATKPESDKECHCALIKENHTHPQLKDIKPLKKHFCISPVEPTSREAFVARGQERHFDKINELTERVNLISNLLNKQ